MNETLINLEELLKRKTGIKDVKIVIRGFVTMENYINSIDDYADVCIDILDYIKNSKKFSEFLNKLKEEINKQTMKIYRSIVRDGIIEAKLIIPFIFYIYFTKDIDMISVNTSEPIHIILETKYHKPIILALNVLEKFSINDRNFKELIKKKLMFYIALQ